MSKPPVHMLYTEYTQGKKVSTALELWGTIPSTMGDAAKHLSTLRKAYGESPETLDELKKAMKSSLRKMGILTGQTADNIDRMHLGVVEAGQQPNCLGGPSLILNKIAYAVSLAEQASLVPLYYVADYDGVQPELTNTRLPSPSSKGLHVSYPLQPGMDNSTIHTVDNPPEGWLTKTLEKIESNYRGLLKGSPVLEEKLGNLYHAFTIIKNAYYSTGNVSEFSTKIIGSILNHEAGLHVPTYWHSMPETRHLFQEGYELLLSEPNRSRFIQATNKAAESVEEAGYRSQIGLRKRDYVPFYLECTECSHIRVELKYAAEGSKGVISGKCPKCGTLYSHSFNPASPDLTEINTLIQPRVDSRQVIIDSVIPVLAHIGGPGETSYYAEVIPAARALKLPFPVFLRYTRTFYNTPWNESGAKVIRDQGYRPIGNEGMYKTLGSWVESRNRGDTDGLAEAHRDIQNNIELNYSELLSQVKLLQGEINEIKGRLREPGDRQPLIRQMRGKQKTLQDLELYLSWAFGRFSPEKYGQEVNWNWLDLAVVSGIRDLMGVYKRIYNPQTPNSSMYYVNLS